jgi:hypothetical protein
MVKIGLLIIFVMVIFLIFFHKKINFPTIVISSVSFVMVLITGVLGLNMRVLPVFFIIHYIAIILAIIAIIYYIITKKYTLYIIMLPIFTLALYILTAYIIGARDNIPL